MLRKCSHCNQNGHNSRTCPNRGVKIFGVRFTDGAIRKSASMGNLTDGAIRKSASMGNLTHYAGSPAEGPDHGCPSAADGYASEDFAQGHSSSSCGERKKGVAWTEDEHRLFLMGLQKLGKGDWRGIARNYVVSRTPTQVASHAQKYFVRQTNASRRKRRTSLFDMVPDEPFDAQMFPISPQEPETQGSNPLPLPAPPNLDEEPEPMDSATNFAGAVPMPETIQYCYPMVFPAFVPPFIPFSVPFWSFFGAGAGAGAGIGAVENKAHEIVKPTATHPTAPVAIDELGGMSQLSLGESRGDTRPSFLSPKLPDGSDRQSAFHANPPTNSSSLNSRSSAIPAV